MAYKLRRKKFNYTDDEILDVIFPKKIFRYDKRPKLVIVPHHIAHAASVFFTSGLKKAAILVIDGQGEDSSTSIAYGEDKTIKVLKSFPIQSSLGYFYEAVNKYIGFHYFDSGKTMGLAPYGKSIFNFKNIKLGNSGYNIVLPRKLKYSPEHLDEQETLVNLWHKKIKEFINQPNSIKYEFEKSKNRIISKLEIPQIYKDFATSAQAVLEKAIDHLAILAVKMTGCNDLCISGGVGLNCVANGKLLYNPLVKTLYIFPAANDAGVSAGAALYASALYDKNADFSRLEHIYLGPHYANRQIRKILNESKIRYKISNNICKETACLLAKNKIISWFQGKMEVGPRALGNRSILASPLKKAMWKRVNIIKGRELWRPFAPSTLEEYKDEYFENAQSSPFMLKTFRVKKNKQSLIPAVVHIDGSTRPQTVSKKTNKKLWLLINEFYKITGVPALLNTSFNRFGEPIVCTLQDAMAMFYNSGLDYLVIDNLIISKENKK
ncbi:MAG: Carbamoyl transferase [Parcubacteria group bacterium GW2011_GWC2_42_12]|nr:MAG: Carbamoyl transferase [Parcubacteria group bacterium GW2011_GWC2_42_12]